MMRGYPFMSVAFPRVVILHVSGRRMPEMISGVAG